MEVGMDALKGATVLCIEDEQDLREVLAEEIEDAGYVVLQAANSSEALALLEVHRPDLILCDIAMPVMDGYELLRLVRESRPDLIDVPFVFLTAQDGSEQIARGKLAGADDYLVKPVNFDLMLATIAARIRQMQRIQERLGNKAGLAVGMTETGAGTEPIFLQMARMFNLIASGVVLLDYEGRVQFVNLAAQRLASRVETSEFLELMGVSNINPHSRAAQAIRQAIHAAEEKREYTEFFSVSGGDNQRDLIVTVCALESDTLEEGGPAVVLFIGGSGRYEPAPIKALESLFKLTLAESRIAWAFAQGLRPDQIAATFDISLTTVAFHKRNVFQKTQTNRQADLMALLLTLPVSTGAK